MNLSECKTAEEKLRWHLINDCTCGCPSEYWKEPYEHASSCPMHDPDNPWYELLFP